MNLEDFYFFNGTSYAGKSTMVHLLAQKYGGFEVNIRDDELGLEGTMALIEKKLGLHLP